MTWKIFSLCFCCIMAALDLSKLIKLRDKFSSFLITLMYWSWKKVWFWLFCSKYTTWISTMWIKKITSIRKRYDTNSKPCNKHQKPITYLANQLCIPLRNGKSWKYALTLPFFSHNKSTQYTWPSAVWTTLGNFLAERRIKVFNRS